MEFTIGQNFAMIGLLVSFLAVGRLFHRQMTDEDKRNSEDLVMRAAHEDQCNEQDIFIKAAYSYNKTKEIATSDYITYVNSFLNSQPDGQIPPYVRDYTRKRFL